MKLHSSTKTNRPIVGMSSPVIIFEKQRKQYIARMQGIGNDGACRCGLFAAGLTRTKLRELLAGSVFPNHSYPLEYRRDRGAPLLVLFRLWFFLLAIASQLTLCHPVLPSLAVDAAL
jgi:hypothetical protein